MIGKQQKQPSRSPTTLQDQSYTGSDQQQNQASLTYTYSRFWKNNPEHDVAGRENLAVSASRLPCMAIYAAWWVFDTHYAD